MKTCVWASAVLSLGLACGPKSEAPPEAGRKTVEAPAPQATEPSPKELLTDDKLRRFALYQAEINKVAHLAVDAAAQAHQRAGGDQKGFEKELSKDERIRKIADAEAAGLSRSGLSRSEASAIGKLITPYLTNRMMGTEDMKKKARTDFEAQHGKAALEAADRHEAELTGLQREMLAAVMKGGRK